MHMHLRISHQELKLPGLVSARRQSGAVISLDPEPRPPQDFAEAVHWLERGRQVAESSAWEPC